MLEARLRCNRSVVLAYQGQIDEALTDASIAERLAADNGQFFLAGGAAHNHAFTAGLQGDIATALGVVRPRRRVVRQGRLSRPERGGVGVGSV